jgi:hypothetical protein
MASVDRFRTTVAHPQNPHRLPLASFRKIGGVLARPQNRHRLPLAPFRKIGARFEHSENSRSLPLGSLGEITAREPTTAPPWAEGEDVITSARLSGLTSPPTSQLPFTILGSQNFI